MNLIARLFAFVAAVLLSSCGGDLEVGVGSGGSGAPVGPLSVGVGSVSGFGSIIVNGVRYDETAAEVLVDIRPDRPVPAAVSALRLGTHVELRHRQFVIERATASSELIGPVASVAATSFVALGQTVRVNGDAAHPTAFEGFAALSGLSPGAVVEVHGDRAPSGEILATRVELQPAGLATTRLAGTASAVKGRSFSIGALSIDASSAEILPRGATLADGQRVVAWSDTVYGGGALVAKIVRLDTTMIGENASVTLDGVVAEFRSASSFRIGGVAVDAGSASFTGGAAAGLENGRSVRVRGIFINAVLKAADVEILPTVAAPIQLTGPITDFVDSASAFRIRDSLVRVTPQTTYLGGSSGNLGTGVQVKVTGPLVDGTVQATSVELLPLPAGPQRVVVGQIAAPIGPIAGDGGRTFRLDGPAMNVKTTATTTYRNGTSDDIAAGRQVSIRGRLDGDLFVADEVQFLDNPATLPNVEIDGTAGNVQATSVVVNGQTVQLTPSTTYTLNRAPTTSASLRNGAQVQIVATRVAGGLSAVSVEVRSPESTTASVRGIVSGRTPPNATQFLVGAQRVNVGSNPTVIPGSKTIADIVNGADVEVDGTISGGVLTATRIKLR